MVKKKAKPKGELQQRQQRGRTTHKALPGIQLGDLPCPQDQRDLDDSTSLRFS
jgi:hypothetical protein